MIPLRALQLALFALTASMAACTAPLPGDTSFTHAEALTARPHSSQTPKTPRSCPRGEWPITRAGLPPSSILVVAAEPAAPIGVATIESFKGARRWGSFPGVRDQDVAGALGVIGADLASWIEPSNWTFGRILAGRERDALRLITRALEVEGPSGQGYSIDVQKLADWAGSSRQHAPLLARFAKANKMPVSFVRLQDGGYLDLAASAGVPEVDISWERSHCIVGL